MATHVNASIGIGTTNAAYGWRAHAAAFGGRIAAAHDDFRQGVQLASQAGFKEVAAQLSIEDAEAHAIVGQCADAVKEVSTRPRTESRQLLARACQPRAGAVRRHARTSPALTAELERRLSGGDDHQSRLVARRCGGRRRHPAPRVDEARSTFSKPVRPYDHSAWTEFWPRYLRAQAHLGLRQSRRSGGGVQDHPESSRRSAGGAELYALAQLEWRRAVAMGGELGPARDAAYDAF